MIKLDAPHSISVIEWLAGFNTWLTGSIAIILFYYLITHRDERWQPHFRIACWFLICAIGSCVRNGWVWIEIFRRPELVDFVAVSEAYPMIAAAPWMIGTLLAAVGIVFLCREFGEAYIGKYTWFPAILVASVIPLFSIWYH